MENNPNINKMRNNQINKMRNNQITEFCSDAGKRASVAGYCSIHCSSLSFDLYCKLIITSDEEITAEIKPSQR